MNEQNELLNLSLSKFTKLLTVIGNEKNYELLVDFYTDLLSIALNKTIDEIEELDFEEHQRLSTDLIVKITDLNSNNKMLSEIRVGPDTYYSNAKENDIKFKTKEFKLIQKIIGTDNYLPMFAAIIFKDKDQNVDSESLNKRAELFAENLTTKDIIAFVNKFTQYLNKNDNNIK